MTAPDGLGERGAALWTSLGFDSPDSASGAVALEACRIADRLEGMHDVIEGKSVLKLMHFRHIFDRDDDTRVFELRVDEALAEARQQQTTFLKLLADLGALKAVPKPKEASPLDELARARSGRGSAAAHSPRTGRP